MTLLVKKTAMAQACNACKRSGGRFAVAPPDGKRLPFTSLLTYSVQTLSGKLKKCCVYVFSWILTVN